MQQNTIHAKDYEFNLLLAVFVITFKKLLKTQEPAHKEDLDTPDHLATTNQPLLCPNKQTENLKL